jgi:hypothetical protein
MLWVAIVVGVVAVGDGLKITSGRLAVEVNATDTAAEVVSAP